MDNQELMHGLADLGAALRRIGNALEDASGVKGVTHSTKAQAQEEARKIHEDKKGKASRSRAEKPKDEDPKGDEPETEETSSPDASADGEEVTREQVQEAGAALIRAKRTSDLKAALEVVGCMNITTCPDDKLPELYTLLRQAAD